MHSEVINAYNHLQEIRKDQVALLEYPIAQLSTLTANINRDAKHRKQPFELQDFLLFTQSTDEQSIRPEAGAAALTMRATGQPLPSVLYGVWPDIVQAAQQCKKPPLIRALISDCQTVALLAPSREHDNWRGLLAVTQQPSGNVITLHDHDRPLLKYKLRLPEMSGGYVMDRELLRAAT